MAGKSNPSRDRGRRAGANAPPTPAQRMEWPAALEGRLRKVGIPTAPRTKKGKQRGA